MTYNANNIRKVHAVPHYFWSSVSWDELNNDERNAWELIGYDQSKWDNNTLQIKKFLDYDQNQKKAIKDLGYEDYTWDAEPVNPEFPTILLDDEDDEEISVDNIVEFWDVHNWEDLDKYQKELFSLIGFDGESFDYNIYPETNYEDFNEEQKDSLSFLGYNQPIWNEILYDQLDDYEEDNNNNYEIELIIELDNDETNSDDSPIENTDDKLDKMEKGELNIKENETDFIKKLHKFDDIETKQIINTYITLKKAHLLKKNISFSSFVLILDR